MRYVVTAIPKADSPMRVFVVKSLLIKHTNNVGKRSTTQKIRKEELWEGRDSFLKNIITNNLGKVDAYAA